MKKVFFLLFLFGLMPVYSQVNIFPEEVQVRLAVLAAPEMYRDEATVLGYNYDGKLVVLQEGENDLVCLADDPNQKGISIACYSKELEPFMARGRQLVAEGKSEDQKRKIRQKEIENGTLQMPLQPAMLYVLTADEKDVQPVQSQINNSKLRYAIYLPYMTAEATGLPTEPQAPGMPWLMDAGTPRSHIMITPAQ